MTRREFLNLGGALVASAFQTPSVDELTSLLVPSAGPIEPDRGENLPFDGLFPPLIKSRIGPVVSGQPVFLTVDDGPLYSMATILDLLASKGHKATFFVIGRNLENPRMRALAVRAVREGHDLGNHSYTHPDFSAISVGRAKREIVATHSLIEEVVKEAGGDPMRQNRFFRFPYGIAGSMWNSSASEDVLSQLNYHIAWWDLDTNDWRMELAFWSRPPAAVIRSLKKARALDVVLLHDRAKTAQHFGSILNVLDSRKMVSLPLSDYDTGSRTPDRHDPPEKQAESRAPMTMPSFGNTLEWLTGSSSHQSLLSRDAHWPIIRPQDSLRP